MRSSAAAATRTPSTDFGSAVSLDVVRSEIVSCEACARLREYCARIARDKKAAHRDETYWGRPVPGFGDPDARLLLVGLAPAAHGANRTGRVFTGDGSGDFLMSALNAVGFANIPTARRADDGLTLRDAYILSAVRCAPPDNKPTPEEIARCRRHMVAEIGALRRLRVVVALGKIGHDAYLAYAADALGVRPRPRPPFGHGSEAHLGDGLPVLLGCYHPSRQNTNTGKLTAPMMRAVFQRARQILETRMPDDQFPDDPGKWKVLSREYVAREPWYTVRVDRVALPNGHVIPKYWISEYPPWVNVVALTNDDDVVLIRQYRHGIEKVAWEIPAGTTDERDTSLEEAAKRELREETGYGGGRWSLLATLSANPALQNNLTYTFLAEGVTRLGDAAPESNEEMSVRLTPLREIQRLIDSGGFVQALHVAPLLMLLLRRHQLNAIGGR